jgi:hypothetical protein
MAAPWLLKLGMGADKKLAKINAAFGGSPRKSDAFPADVTESIASFVRDIESALDSIRRGEIEANASAQVAAACEQMKATLSRYILEESSRGPIVGARVFRDAFPYLMMSALFRRSYTKPRGYAGDFETIEMIYRAEPRGAGPVGRMIDAWNLATDTSNAVRSRRARIVSEVTAVLADRAVSEPLRMTSMAVGSGREIFDLFDALPEAPLQATGIDLDAGAIAFCAAEARARCLNNQTIRLHQENLIRLAFGRSRIPIAGQDFVYSMGLIDYLADELVVRLMNWAHDQLAPGGTLALGNFALGNPERPYMDHVLDWLLIHRSPDQLRDLFARSKFGKTEVRVDADVSGIQLFACCTKN